MQSSVEVVLVDWGNSSLKATPVSNGQFSGTERYSDWATLKEKYRNYPWVISTVRKISEEDLEGLQYLIISNQVKLPIQLNYKTPESLGADRIAAAVGASSLFPGENNLVVDLGTCMTIDLIDKKGIFQGGVISPGLRTRMRSMAHYTDKLPDISEEWKSVKLHVLGNSTKECLLSGAMMGIIHEIAGVQRRLAEDFTSLNTIITGGDAEFFESNLKAHIFAGSKIVHEGLYRIWKFQ